MTGGSDSSSEDTDTTGTILVLKTVARSGGNGTRIHTSEDTIRKSNKANLAQVYITNPLLVKKKKVDVHMLFAIASLDPLTIYMYENGFIRNCSKKYSSDPDTFKNNAIHNPNYLVKEHNLDFKAEDNDKYFHQDFSNKIGSFKALRRVIPKIAYKAVLSQIKDIGVKTILAIEAEASAQYKQLGISPNKGFDLLGFDFLIDDSHKVWLMEVHQNPDMRYLSPFTHAAKPRLIADLFTLIGLDTQVFRADYK